MLTGRIRWANQNQEQISWILGWSIAVALRNPIICEQYSIDSASHSTQGTT